jgi:hypothetical protein
MDRQMRMRVASSATNAVESRMSFDRSSVKDMVATTSVMRRGSRSGGYVAMSDEGDHESASAAASTAAGSTAGYSGSSMVSRTGTAYGKLHVYDQVAGGRAPIPETAGAV